MSTDEAKRSVTGGLAKPINSDDRKLVPVAAHSVKKIVIKNADMKEDMQREAIDIAVAVSSSIHSTFLAFFLVL